MAALCYRKLRAGQTWFWAGLWLGGAGLAWGTVVYRIAFLLLPPLRQLPGVSRAVVICHVAGAVLTGFGFEALSRAVEARGQDALRRLLDRTALLVGLLTLAAGTGVWLYSGRLETALPGIGTYTLVQMLRCLGLLLASVAAVALLTWTPTPRGETATREAVPARAGKGRRGGTSPAAGPGEAALVRPGRLMWGRALLFLVVAADRSSPAQS